MESYLRWGNKEVHPRYGTEHFLVVGASGSGKTTLLNMLMRSVLESGRQVRAMVYDPKQETLPYLYNLVAPERVKVLHPFDSRACAWNLAEDIDNPVSARQFATILVPDMRDTTGAESFFLNAVRDLVTGVILTFVNCIPRERSWRFRDLVLTMLYEPYLRYILALNSTREGMPFPMTARLRSSYLPGDPARTDPRTTSNIRASINTRLAIYESVAAVWHEAQEQGRTFSLARWVEEDCDDVLALGNDEASRAAIDAINQAIFKRVTELLLASRETTPTEKDTGQNQTWMFLDEVREAGELDGLSRLLTKARSKGVCVAMGFQDIDGMRDAYGGEVAHEICGQCNNVAVLKLNSPSTAEWATELFGRRLTASQSSSRGISSEGGMQMGREIGEVERPWVFTSDLLYLPTTSPRNGLHGYFRDPAVDPAKHKLRVELNWQSDIGPHLPEKHPDVIDAEARREKSRYMAIDPTVSTQFYLKPWDAKDWKRLGFADPFRDLLGVGVDSQGQGQLDSAVPRASRDPMDAHRASELARMATEEQVYLRVMRDIRAELGMTESEDT